MATQTDRILAHLQSGKPLTPIQAFRKFGTMRLAARIAELRGSGHRIQTTTAKGKQYATYRMA